MSYRNKTYVVFDGDKDMWAYAFMLGWKTQDHIDFNFHDAHDLKPLTDRATEETVKRSLRTRFSNTKQLVVLIGESTRYLYKFVRWELDIAIELGIPIIAVNLNGSRSTDYERCPPILMKQDAIHVAFKMKIIQYAMNNYCSTYLKLHAGHGEDLRYPDSLYKNLGLL